MAMMMLNHQSTMNSLCSHAPDRCPFRLQHPSSPAQRRHRCAHPNTAQTASCRQCWILPIMTRSRLLSAAVAGRARAQPLPRRVQLCEPAHRLSSAARPDSQNVMVSLITTWKFLVTRYSTTLYTRSRAHSLLAIRNVQSHRYAPDGSYKQPCAAR